MNSTVRVRIVTRFNGNEYQIRQTENQLRRLGMTIRDTYMPLGIITGYIHLDRYTYINRLENFVFKGVVTPAKYAGELPLTEEDLMDRGEHDLIANGVFGMR